METAGVQIDPKALHLFQWLREQPLVLALIITMGLDILSGIAAAFITKKLSSTASWEGMSKKALIWLVVGGAAAIEGLTPLVPLTKIVCSFYVLTEGLSILENAGRAGVPLPKALVDSLYKLQATELQPAPAQSVNIHEASLVNVQPPGATTIVGDPIAGPRGERGARGDRGPQGTAGKDGMSR